MKQLSGFRFLLSVHLLLFHTIPAGYLSPTFQYLNSFGSVSTSLFIIISGFSLSYAYSNRPINYKQFMYRRFLKLYPLHLLIVLVSTIIYFDIFIRGVLGMGNIMVISKDHFASLAEFLIMIFSSIFMIDSWNPFFMGISAAGWTLSCLFFCYFLFPYIIVKSSRYNSKQLVVSLFVLFSIVLIIPTIIILLKFNNEYMKSITQIYSFPSFLYGLLHKNPLIRLPEFVLGIVLYRLYEKKQTDISTHKIYGLGISVFIVMCLMRKSVPFAFIHNGFFIPLELIILWILVSKETVITKILSHKIMVQLGNMSFSLYLIHIPLYSIYMRVDRMIYRITTFGTSHFIPKMGSLNSKQISEYQNYTPHIASYILYLVLAIAISLYVQRYFTNIFYEKYKTEQIRVMFKNTIFAPFYLISKWDKKND